jgi:hypothetical protein
VYYGDLLLLLSNDHGYFAQTTTWILRLTRRSCQRWLEVTGHNQSRVPISSPHVEMNRAFLRFRQLGSPITSHHTQKRHQTRFPVLGRRILSGNVCHATPHQRMPYLRLVDMMLVLLQQAFERSPKQSSACTNTIGLYTRYEGVKQYLRRYLDYRFHFPI